MAGMAGVRLSLLVWLFARVTWGWADINEHVARTSSRDVGLPSALVERVESDYLAYLQSQGVMQKQPIKRAMLNIRAELKQKRPGALHEDVRVVTPLGGGVIDLADLVTPVRGAFTAKIVATHEDGDPARDIRVFYVSRARQRKISGDNYGAGCDKWMNVTGFFKKVMSGGGFELYTADQRYLSVLGGTFLILQYAKEAIFVGSMTFTDSRYHHLLCE